MSIHKNKTKSKKIIKIRQSNDTRFSFLSVLFHKISHLLKVKQIELVIVRGSKSQRATRKGKEKIESWHFLQMKLVQSEVRHWKVRFVLHVTEERERERAKNKKYQQNHKTECRNISSLSFYVLISVARIRNHNVICALSLPIAI